MDKQRSLPQMAEFFLGQYDPQQKLRQAKARLMAARSWTQEKAYRMIRSRAQRDGLPISQVVRREVQTTAPDTLVADIMPVAAEAPYPIAVVDEGGQLKGIVTKASVLASLI